MQRTQEMTSVQPDWDTFYPRAISEKIPYFSNNGRLYDCLFAQQLNRELLEHLFKTADSLKAVTRKKEGADHVGEGVDVAKIGGEGGLVQGFFRERGNVSVFDAGVDELAWVALSGQAVEAVVGNLGDAEVGLARIARALRHLLLGQHDEERSLAYLGQAYDAGFHKEAISN